MTRKSRILVALGCIAVLAAVEQAGWAHLSYSRTVSGTGLNSARKPAPAGDLAYTVQIERPAARWLPFFKFGNTLHRRTYWERQEGTDFEHVVTTRTNTLVIGLCSTRRYEKLSDHPFEEARKRYQAKNDQMAGILNRGGR